MARMRAHLLGEYPGRERAELCHVSAGEVEAADGDLSCFASANTSSQQRPRRYPTRRPNSLDPHTSEIARKPAGLSTTMPDLLREASHNFVATAVESGYARRHGRDKACRRDKPYRRDNGKNR